LARSNKEAILVKAKDQKRSACKWEAATTEWNLACPSFNQGKIQPNSMRMMMRQMKKSIKSTRILQS